MPLLVSLANRRSLVKSLWVYHGIHNYTEAIMYYNGSRPDVILFNRRPYTVSSRSVIKEGQNGRRVADPSYVTCTPYLYRLQDYKAYCAWHSERGGQVIYDRDYLYRFSTNVFVPYKWHRDYPGYTAWARADDAAEDILSQLFDFWQGLKDSVDAVKTVTSTVSRIDSALPYLRDGNFSKAARKVTGRHIIANSWLEYNFAILPTIHTAQLAIQHAIKDRSQAFRMHKKRSEVLTHKVDREDYYFFLHVSLSLKAEGSVTRYFTAQAMQQNFDRMAFSRPAPAMWDAVPWSFCIDWFLPVGTWLDQMSRITQYASDGCDVSCCRLIGDYTFLPNYEVSSFYSERTHCEDFWLDRRVNKQLGAKTWDLQGLLDRAEFGINARRLSYLTAIVASKYRKTFAGGLL